MDTNASYTFAPDLKPKPPKETSIRPKNPQNPQHQERVSFMTPLRTSSSAAVSLLRRLAPQDVAALEASERPFPVAAGDSGSRLLVTGCGHSGTHAVFSALRNHGIDASHEGIGRQATVGWMYAAAGAHRNATDLWTFRNTALLLRAGHDPIIKIHRDPLFVVTSIARGFTENGRCQQGPYDMLSWALAARFVSLPEARAIGRWQTCRLDRTARLRMALHYWVKWNLLSDRWATLGLRVEQLTFQTIAAAWCTHCRRESHCVPIPSAVCRAAHGDSHSAQSTVRELRSDHNSTTTTVSWKELLDVDPGMTLVARLLAEDYGYVYPQAEPMVTASHTVLGRRAPGAGRRASDRAASEAQM
eukprot:6079746-Prymnesium_polylepis.3